MIRLARGQTVVGTSENELMDDRVGLRAFLGGDVHAPVCFINDDVEAVRLALLRIADGVPMVQWRPSP